MDERYGQLIQPQPVRFALGAPGWYVLGALILLALVGAVWLVLRRYRRNRYRREALAELKGYGGGKQAVYPANMLLKRVAVLRYGRSSAAAIRGMEWIAFLNRARGASLFGVEDAALLEQLYGAGKGDPEGFIRRSEEWIRKHKYAL